MTVNSVETAQGQLSTAATAERRAVLVHDIILVQSFMVDISLISQHLQIIIRIRMVNHRRPPAVIRDILTKCLFLSMEVTQKTA